MTISRATLFWGIGICSLLAIVLQIGVLHLGFAAASADESARALIAQGLDWGNAFKPYIWPPFYQVAVGLWLKVHPDLFYGPREMAVFFGLLSLWAVAALALELFGDRLVALVSAILAVFLHHRLLLSVAPMSEIFFNCFVLWGAYGVARYTGRGQSGALVFGALMFMLSGTVRFEGWFVSLAFIAFVLWQQTAAGRADRAVAFLAVGIALAFPLLWVGLSFYHYGDLSGITVARDQNISVGTSWTEILRNSHLLRFLSDASQSALILGLIASLGAFWYLPSTRAVIAVAVLGMGLASLAAVATASNPLAAPWRIAGAWVSQLIPFSAMALVWLARKAGVMLRLPVLAGGVMLSVASLAWNGWQLVERRLASPFHFDADILALRNAIGNDVNPATARVLIDSEKVFFLDVVVALNRPDATEYTTGNDPVSIALYIGAKDYWQAEETPEGRAIYAKYIAPKFDPAAGASLLADRGIRYVILQDKELRAQTADMEGVTFRGAYGPWHLFERM